MATNAFATLVMRDPKYVAAALVLGSSLSNRHPHIPRICVHTDDIPAKFVDALKLAFLHVVEVPYIYGEGLHQPYKRFRERYDWIDASFTKLQLIHVGARLGFKKILAMDADTLVLGDMTELFNLTPPAGILSLADYDHHRWHGQKCADRDVAAAVRSSYGIRGCLMLLSTDKGDFEALINELHKRPISRLSKQKLKGADSAGLAHLYIGGYGDQQAFIGPDERLYTEVLQRRHGWTHIHHRFCITAWHLDKLSQHEELVGLHFVSEKPWERAAIDQWWPDFDFWYKEAARMVGRHPKCRAVLPKSVCSVLEREKWVNEGAKESDNSGACDEGPVRHKVAHHPHVQRILSSIPVEAPENKESDDALEWRRRRRTQDDDVPEWRRK